MSAAFIGLDLATSVFQVHGVDVQGKVVVTKRRRDAVLAFFANLAPCVVGMEACAGSHFWAREIASSLSDWSFQSSAQVGGDRARRTG
jgi:transposase